MANIFARSPFIVSINETGQVKTRIDVYIWNGTGSIPSTPSYTLSKLIPSSTKTLTTYDISPYIREYLSFTTRQDPTSITALNTSQWCNIYIDKWYYDSGGVDHYVSHVDALGFDGYTYYESGSNYDQGYILLSEKTYYYQSGIYSGQINLYMDYINSYLRDYVVYTKPDLSTSTTVYCTSSGLKCIPRVHSSYTSTGNIVKVYNSGGDLRSTHTFLPICEPKYTPVVIDFINKYGAWQREFFFKASKSKLDIESSDYNVMQSSITNYDIKQGQKKSFNTNARETISVNSGFVYEDFSDNIKQLIMSERILVDNKPAICKTKSLDVQKSINNHMINYSLEFELAYNTINSVI
ncbi:hypothetical protein UFOVP207_55 [uncultured Caudovirales phage]|uniref:Uncharacterized protein n=1 Tax=uncultured Caudovirales phage TaxID=2100421 RepID=A0A6J7WRP5_9CAUD|nr:hypothetical protein UFOVP207_55 [uncultured Caudovirales phage]